MNYIQYMQTPFGPIMQQDATLVQQTYPVQAIVHPLSQTEGYLAWAAKQSNPSVEEYEKFLQETQKNKSTISQGREMTEREKLASQQKLELYGQLEKEAQDRQKAGEVVLEGLNYISPSYWANQAGLGLNGAQSFVFDIAADPTTYLSMGVLPVAKQVGKKATKEVVEKTAKEAVEKTVKEGVEKGKGEIVLNMASSTNTPIVNNPFGFGTNTTNQLVGAYETTVQMLRPGGAWYERQLANGIPKEEVEKLANFYLQEISDVPMSLSPGLEGAWGKARISFPDGVSKPISSITIDATAPDKVGTTIHELAHVMSRNAEVRIPQNIDPVLKTSYEKLLRGQPELYAALKNNTDMLPLKRRPEFVGKPLQHNTQQEIRSRAFGAESDAFLKHVDLDTYVDNPELWGQQMKQLAEVFDLESIRHFLKNYKVLLPAVGTAGLVLSTTGETESLKQSGMLNYLNYYK